MDAFDVLGVPPNSSKDECKAAYRRLASQHHPDKGGKKEVFQAIQRAWEMIETGYRRVVKPQPKPSSYFRQETKSQPKSDPYEEATWMYGDPVYGESVFGQKKKGTTFEEAANAFRANTGPQSRYRPADGREPWGLQSDGMTLVLPPLTTDYVMPIGEFDYVIPKETPNGWKGSIVGRPSLAGTSGSDHRTFHVKIKHATDESMRVQPIGIEHGRYAYANQVSDVVCAIKTNAVNLVTGAWVKVMDVFGEYRSIRIPEGFDPSQRIRVNGGGYWKWNDYSNRAGNGRADLIVEVIPEFTSWVNVSNADKANAKQFFTRVFE